MRKLKHYAYPNKLRQLCCVCHNYVEKLAGLCERSQLTKGDNDVYHIDCAKKYYEQVLQK